MENYIVRIYRRDEANPDKLTGVFESVEKETRSTFTTLDSLIDLLTLKQTTHARSSKSGNHESAQTQKPATITLKMQ